jgi:C-terminal processing protease CtpA/Prc
LKLTRYQPRLTQSRLTALLAGLVIGIAGCGGGSGGSGVEAPQGSSCTILEQNEFVQDVMQEFYLWNDRLPVADPAEFDSPQAYLDALRVPEDIYSFITPAAVEEAFYGEGQFAGLGFQSRQVEGQVRLLDVYEGSPAHEGGLRRGDSIVAVDGRPIGEILANEGFSASLGPPEAGVTVELTWRDVAGEEFTRTFTKAVVTIPPVSSATLLDTPTGFVGYMLFRAFVEPGDPALNQAFAELGQAGVTRLVVDLRYNSGGLLAIAEVLANLIGGAVTQGQIQYTLEYNPDNAGRNDTRFFRDSANALDLQQVVFITTRATASASELVINALEPFVDVVLIGDRTFGKPVGQLGFVFCEQVLRPVSFRIVNAIGTTDYFDGFAPDCPAADDLDHPFGDPAEGSLGEALYFLENGSCSAVASPEARDGLSSKPGDTGTRRWKVLDAQ